jgi:hypothetical protein
MEQIELRWRAYSARISVLVALLSAAASCSESGTSAAAAASPIRRLGPPEGDYGRQRRIEVAIEIKPEDWERLRVEGRSLAQILAPDPIAYRFTGFGATVTVDGVVREGVEIKKKGFIGSSGSSPTQTRTLWRRTGTI